MPFRPQVDDQLTINGTTYRTTEHPAAPGVPYGQEGRQAIVYQLTADDDARRALKVFKPRYRLPALVSLAGKLKRFADLPGLSVCRRTVLSPQRHGDLLGQYPDLTYGVLMPWVEGPTWMEVLLEKRELSPAQSLTLARSLTETLAAMEERGVAHCDLSGPNVLLPALLPSPAGGRGVGGEGGVALVDVEQLHAPGLERPELLPGGSPGYAHKTAPDGLWGSVADRFAGAVLLAEMLGWCDERVRETAWGENYFDPAEMQQDCERYHILVQVLREYWGDSVATLFGRAWRSETLADCPSFGEWLVALGTWDSQKEEENAMEQKDAKERLARAGVEKAKALMVIGQVEQALEELEEAHHLAPELVAENYARALVEHAAQREDAGDLKESLTLYRRALQVAPEESALRREIVAIISRLEEQLHGPVPVESEVVSRPAARVELPAGRVILWLAIMLIGWAGAIGGGRLASGNKLVVAIIWAVTGALVGLVQWLVIRKISRANYWWLLVSPVGWAGCWALGGIAATMIGATLFVDRGGGINYTLQLNLWWIAAWQLALLLNAIFNGAAAVLLLRNRPAGSQSVSNTK